MSARPGSSSCCIALALAAGFSACTLARAAERTLVARIDMTLNHDPSHQFKGAWKVSFPLEAGRAGDWKSRGWDQLVYEGTVEIKSMQRPFALTVGFADAAVGSGQIGKHAAFSAVTNIPAPGSYKFSSRTILDQHGKSGNEHTSFRNVQSFFFIIWQLGHSWRASQFARDPSYYPISLKISLYAPVAGVEAQAEGDTGSGGTHGGLHCGKLAELKDVAQMLKQGLLGAAFQAAERELEAGVAARAAEARRVIEALRAYAARRRRELKSLRAREPEWALRALRELAASYSGSEIGRSLAGVPLEWSRDDAFRKLVAARRLLSYIERLTKNLRRKIKGRSLSDPRRLRKYQHYVRNISQAERILATRYPQQIVFHQRAAAVIARLGLPKQ